jgi:hypothetical protein
MDGHLCIPKTYMSHSNQKGMRVLLEEVFSDPDPNRIGKEIIAFMHNYPIPIDDFPLTPIQKLFFSKVTSEFFSATGFPETFDNHIHQVKVVEEALSIHISSDEATKDEIFNRIL